MKTTQTTRTGIIYIFCSKCGKKQLAIYPGSSYMLQNPAAIPQCKKCLGIRNIHGEMISKLKGKKIKQNNRKKYKKRIFDKRRTLKS